MPKSLLSFHFDFFRGQMLCLTATKWTYIIFCFLIFFFVRRRWTRLVLLLLLSIVCALHITSSHFYIYFYFYLSARKLALIIFSHYTLSLAKYTTHKKKLTLTYFTMPRWGRQCAISNKFVIRCTDLAIFAALYNDDDETLF